MGKVLVDKVDVLNDSYEVLITLPRGYMDESVPVDLQTLLQPQENQDDVSRLEHVLYRLRHLEIIPAPMKDSRTPSVFVGYQPDLTRYDQVQRTEVRK